MAWESCATPWGWGLAAWVGQKGMGSSHCNPELHGDWPFSFQNLL